MELWDSVRVSDNASARGLVLERETSVVKILGTILVAALAVNGQPAAKPDFSGQWKANTAKSNFAGLPPPEFITRNITHAEPELTIVEEQRPALGDEKVTRKYVTDGSASTLRKRGRDRQHFRRLEGTDTPGEFKRRRHRSDDQR